MRNEKKLLVGEIGKHLDKSNYVFFTDFRGVTVSDVANLRQKLWPEQGEFHVIKKSLLKKATEARSLPMPEGGFEGQIALVVGGKNPVGIAKLLKEFHKNSKEGKLAMRGGLLGGKLLSLQDISTLADLPGIDILRTQFLALLNTPATKLLRTMNAVPQGVLNVLQAKVRL
ncbi:MAG: 50S ribosomal protein L10 [Puniceicoccales bacterium]|jgi:large subunit ribosomal protein L10|nr:50S ribosomal protein L10 [Puniceicoccales bacterium]